MNSNEETGISACIWSGLSGETSALNENDAACKKMEECA